MVDARLKDGSRVNAIIPPLALRGPVPHHPQVLADASSASTTSSASARSTRAWRASSTRAVIARRNILVSGGTGSGKTTLLNVLSSAIPEDERIVTIEDAAELRLVAAARGLARDAPAPTWRARASTRSATW